MTAIRNIRRFFRSETGAITVDWVVLTATIAALGIAVAVTVGGSSKNLADKISGKIQLTDVMTY